MTKVKTLEDILIKSADVKIKEERLTGVSKKTATKANNNGIKGQPKSGRVWKSERKRFSSIVKTKGIRNSFENKETLRKDMQRVKNISNQRVAAKKEATELKKEKRRENLKRQEENRKKSEVVQVITNTAKLKKMKKKQLRSIEKRDTN